MFQREQSDSKKNVKHWLVKTGGKVLGPYTYDEITAKLRSKEFVAIDEIVLPLSRWRIIRDEPTFKEVIEEIRRAQFTTREDTEIQGTASHSNTVTQTVTEQISESTVRGSRELVPFEPNAVPDANASSESFHYDQNQVQDAEYVEEEAQAPERNNARSQDLRQYGISGSDNYRQSKSGFVGFMWFAAAIIAVGAVFLLMHSQNQTRQRDDSSGESFASLKTQASVAYSHGDFKSALNFYQKADRQKENQPEITSRLAPLLIQLQSGGGEAKRMLTETMNHLPKELDQQSHAELETGLGLAALSSEDLVEAESRFKEALSHYSKFFPARFDLAMVSYLAKSYSESARRFNEAGDEASALYMRARSLLNSENTPGNATRDAATTLERLSSKFFDYRQEAFVLLASVDLAQGDTRAAATRLRWALDTDPELTSDHWHDPLIYSQPLAWRDLIPRCQQLNDELKTSSARALLALCLFKAGDTDEAQRLAAEALTQWPEEPILEAVSASMLMMSGRAGDARAALRLATAKLDDVPLLALITRGKVCAMDGDSNCAIQTWQQLLDKKQALLPALAGLAEQSRLAGDAAKSAEFAKRAKELSPFYRSAMVFKK